MSCYLAVAQRFNVPADLLRSIAHVESGENAYAVHLNSNGTIDVGWMQINSAFFPVLARYGVQIKDLFQPCVNIAIGGWILAQEVDRFGYTWQAIGAYNAGPYDARSRDRKLPLFRDYARRVLAYWRRIWQPGE
jgi:soluble lytic murein transglycosylase-like protein